MSIRSVELKAALPGMPAAANAQTALHAVGVSPADLPATAARAYERWLYAARGGPRIGRHAKVSGGFVKRGFGSKSWQVHGRHLL